MKKKFKFLEHTADIKFQAFGKTIEEVFTNSALAMFNAMNSEKIKKERKHKIKVKGEDNESLLYNFLEELLFLFETKEFFLSEVNSMKIKDKELTAEIVGEDSKECEINIDIKAITYNDMFVRKKGSKWIAQVVLDV